MIHYQLTEQEVVRGLLKYRREPVRIWAGSILGVIGVVLMIAGLPFFRPTPEMPFYLGCLFIGLAIGLLLFRPFLIRRAFMKVVRNNPVFTVPKDVSFNEKNILFSSSIQNAEVFWTSFKKLTEDNQYYYLHTDTLGTVTLLPKSAFDEAARQEFEKCSQSVPRA